jgi:hypothetical protein
MGRALLILNDDATRDKARQWLAKAPRGSRITFQGPKRTLDQNSALWAALTDLSTQLLWHGQRLSPEDWKLVTLAGLKQEMRIVPNMEGNGFVQLGRSSSDLSKEEMTDLLSLIYAFGAGHGVTFGVDA